VLFDMDGTLVDSTAVVEAVWGEFAARHGIDFGELLGYIHGRQAIDTVRRYLPGHDDPRSVVAELQDGELARLEGIVEIRGAARLLAALPPERVAVVTSAPRPLAEARLRAAGLPVPPVLVTADDVDRGKPDPDGYVRAARALGSEPADAVVFEDADAGIRAGLGAGATTVVVGPFDGPSAQGLLRVRDLEQVAVRESDGGRVVLAIEP
jgi:sugar-phosphatase